MKPFTGTVRRFYSYMVCGLFEEFFFDPCGRYVRFNVLEIGQKWSTSNSNGHISPIRNTITIDRPDRKKNHNTRNKSYSYSSLSDSAETQRSPYNQHFKEGLAS